MNNLRNFLDHFVANWHEPFIVVAALAFDAIGGNDPEVQMTAAMWLYRMVA